ncbi:hypothetical protein ACHHYP_20089 [Achlya hypogyna]|uniref:Uncharacterized protein n=1 Tax=Achlya hypogyna TaxID=1202772 RepID=A0A1V9Z778_ACHHY|nr:hypothetical protein ACHHYP_20089 [Achlya hypogyna]
METKLACVSACVALVHRRNLATTFYLFARFRSWASVASAGRRRADAIVLTRRGRPVLLAWWKHVLLAKQTRLLEQTRAMLRRHPTRVAPRSIVDTSRDSTSYERRFALRRKLALRTIDENDESRN